MLIKIYKLRFLSLVLAAGLPCSFANAQLEHIPHVRAAVQDSQYLQAGVILLTTRDNHVRYSAPNHFTSSIQIVDPLQPWPPIFFSNIKVNKNDIGSNGIFQDIRFQDDVRQLTFFQAAKDKADKGSKSMYLICDTNFSVIDTFLGTTGHVTGHGFQINSNGERLYFANTDTVLDLSDFSGDDRDTAVPVALQLIQIQDKNNRLLFSWNPLDHIPLSDTYSKLHEFGERDQLMNGWNWSRATSLRFTHDGNIIYSFRHIGVGKINRDTGMLMWKLGGKSTTLIMPENAEYYRQHDFQEISPNTFSLFSNGEEETPCRLMIFKVNEEESKVEIAKVIQPSPPVFSTHGGNFQILDNGMYLLNYGNDTSLDDWHKVFEFADTSGKVHAEYHLPCMNHAFQAHLVKSWKPYQPTIINENGVLKVSGIPISVSWYLMKDSDVIHVSDSMTIHPESSGTYIATTKQGFGWLVTKPYSIH